MKGIIQFLALLLLSYQVASLPYDNHAALESRDATAQNEPGSIAVIVYVDESGKTLSVDHLNPPTTTVNNSPTDIPPIPLIPDLVVPNELVPTLPNLVAGPPPPPPSIFHHNEERRFGISYSPYNADNTCRNQQQVNADMDKLSHYAYVRIYGVDCDQTRTVTNAARERGMKVFAGVYDLQNFEASLNLIIQAAANDWSTIHTVSIGNELINRGAASVQDVTAATATARSRLRAAGYQGPVVTTDTFSQMLQNPQLCEASDYCAANCHAFFDANQTPDRAGWYAREQARKLSHAHPGKRTIITESGWPHRGRANGAAVPSPENQRVAIDSLRRTFGGDPDGLVLFSAFDDLWKSDWDGTFDAEKYWGIENR